MGLAYALTTGAVLVGAAGVMAMLTRIARVKPWLAFVGMAGLVVALARVAGGVYRPLNDVGFAHAAGLTNLDRRWGVAVLALAGLVVGGVGLGLLAARTEEPSRRPRAALLGLLGLAVGLAALAPGGLRDAHYLNGRAAVAGYAWLALAFALAVMALAADLDLPAAAAGTGLLAGVAALGFAAADSAGLTAFALGVATALALPAAVQGVAATVAAVDLTASVVPVLAGVALLAIADLGAGFASDLPGPTVLPSVSTPAIPCPPGARCPAPLPPWVVPTP